MGFFRNEAKYPVLNDDPTFHDCFAVSRYTDYLKWGGVTLACWGYGFMVGRPRRYALAGLCASYGLMFGGIILVQNTRDRLLGLQENEREAIKLGLKNGTQVGNDVAQNKE